MPLPACKTEHLPITTQCIWALQPLASTAAAARGPHLSVRVGPRKEKAAPGLERPLCSQWAGRDTVSQEKEALRWGPNIIHLTPNSGPLSSLLLSEWELEQGSGFTKRPIIGEGPSPRRPERSGHQTQGVWLEGKVGWPLSCGPES